MAKWPTGIDPHGNGIRIRLWRGSKLVFSETITGSPYKTSDLAAAVKYRAEIKARLDLGLPLRLGEAGAAALFADVAQEWLDSFDGTLSTSLDYENIVNRHWLPVFGNWLISDIRTQHIKTYIAKIKHLSLKTRKNILSPLRGIFTHAMDASYISTNPAAALKLKKLQAGEIARFLPEERTAVLAQLEGQPLLYFTLLFACGLRPGGEPLGLLWSDWNGEEFRVHRQIVRRQVKDTTKTNTARKVYVPHWARDSLLAAPSRALGGPVFLNTKNGAFKDTDKFNDAWRQALQRAELQYRIPYVCRHTRAAELLSTGVQPGDAAKQLGHTLEMFYRTYSEWIDEYSGKSDLRRFEGFTVPKPSRDGFSSEKVIRVKKLNGDPDGTRTRDLRRDRPAF